MSQVTEAFKEEFLKGFSYYDVSLALFILMNVGAAIETNTRLLELGTGNDNISRVQLIWYYFSSTFSQLFKVLSGITMIFILTTIVFVLFYGISRLIGYDPNGDTLLEVAKKNMTRIFGFFTQRISFTAFLLTLPIFAFMFMYAFAMTVYVPTEQVQQASAEDDVGETKSTIMITLHHYLYYHLMVFLIAMFLYIIIVHYVTSV